MTDAIPNPKKLTLATVMKAIENLAAMTAKGFESIETRFVSVETRLDKIEYRLDTMDQRLDGIDQRLEGVDQRLDAMDQKLYTIDQKLLILETGQENIQLRMGSLAYRFEVTDLKQRVEKLESKRRPA